jgi:hypothetical protein
MAKSSASLPREDLLICTRYERVSVMLFAGAPARPQADEFHLRWSPSTDYFITLPEAGFFVNLEGLVTNV